MSTHQLGQFFDSSPCLQGPRSSQSQHDFRANFNTHQEELRNIFAEKLSYSPSSSPFLSLPANHKLVRLTPHRFDSQDRTRWIPQFENSPVPSEPSPSYDPPENYHKELELEENGESPVSEVGLYELEYSELEENVTPRKPTCEILEASTTVQRKKEMSCATEGPLSQKGLKKLARLAYGFASQLKRTTYKQVARRLILQLSSDKEIEIQKNGQLNIKRRVYDALNVIIALGILQRQGNKIYGRKSDQVPRFYLKKGKITSKEELLKKQLKMINDQILKKEETIIAKRAIAKAIHEKFIGIKHLINRNREVHEPHQYGHQGLMEEELAKESDQRGSYSKKDHNSRIKLPFLVIMTKDIDKLHQGISEDTDRFRLLKYSREQITFCLPQKIVLDNMGDLDFIQCLRQEPQRVHRVEVHERKK